MDPGHLRQQLQADDQQHAGRVAMSAALSTSTHGAAAQSHRRPRLLYVIPVGQNPTGVVMTLQRKHQLYQVGWLL